MNKDHYELKAKLNALANARQQMLVENKNMDELERYAMPLIWAFLIALVLFVGALAIDAYIKEISKSLAHTAFIMSECMNGRSIMIDDAIMHCSIEKYNLIRNL